jgi:hypothetical protein
MEKLRLMFLSALALVFSAGMIAQDCKVFFPVEKGTEMTMKNYNAKDKLTGSTINKILDKQVDGSMLKVIFSSRSLDEKGKETGSGQLEVGCKEGTFYIDMKNYLDDQMMSAYKDMQVEIEANNAMQFPAKTDVGTSLPDADIKVKISNQGIPMFTMVVKITNRKIEGKESITTPAGTFDCFKMTYDVETKTMMTVKTKGTDWFSENVGTVRSETFDKNGKLYGYSVLESLTH